MNLVCRVYAYNSTLRGICLGKHYARCSVKFGIRKQVINSCPHIQPKYFPTKLIHLSVFVKTTVSNLKWRSPLSRLSKAFSIEAGEFSKCLRFPRHVPRLDTSTADFTSLRDLNSKMHFSFNFLRGTLPTSCKAILFFHIFQSNTCKVIITTNTLIASYQLSLVLVTYGVCSLKNRKYINECMLLDTDM